jgi:hypothetical protein
LSLLLLFGLYFAPCILCFENRRTLKTLRQNLAREWECLRPVKNVCAQPLRLKRNVCGPGKMFALAEKCLRPVKNVRAQPLRLKRNVCGLWKMFALAEKCLRPRKNVCGLKNGAKRGKIRNQKT